MAKWKFLEKSKETKKIPENIEKKPLAEYKETLYTETQKSKPSTPSPSDQRIWRDVKAIEENIDHIHTSDRPVSDLDKTVDKLIGKIKR